MKDCTYCLNLRALENARGEYVSCPACIKSPSIDRSRSKEAMRAAIRAAQRFARSL